MQDELSEEEMGNLQKMLGDSELISVAKLQELRSNITAPPPSEQGGSAPAKEASTS